MPRAVMDMPSIEPEHEDYWTCYQHVSAQRQSGMGVNPVTVDAVVAWCDLYRVNAWRRPLFWEVVREIDAVERTLMEENRGSGNDPADETGRHRHAPRGAAGFRRRR